MITKEQLEEIHDQEGSGKSWYNKIISMGYEEDVDIKTITHSPDRLQEVEPDVCYLKVIKEGILDMYGSLDEAVVDFYLLKSQSGNR